MRNLSFLTLGHGESFKNVTLFFKGVKKALENVLFLVSLGQISKHVLAMSHFLGPKTVCSIDHPAH